MAIQTFQRIEKKYLINQDQKDALEKILVQYMDYDAYCKNQNRYLIRNIYYDTTDRNLIHQSVAKPYHKEKIRVRKYGDYFHEKDEFFLEIKRKTGKVVSKRRVKLTECELLDFFQQRQLSKRDNYLDEQVLKEITYFLSIYSLQPTVFISYERMAYFDRFDPEFRLTFDSQLQYRRENLDFLYRNENKPLLDSSFYIMEIKVHQAMPLWLAQALSMLHIHSLSFSKYGQEYKLFLQEEKKDVCIHIT